MIRSVVDKRIKKVLVLYATASTWILKYIVKTGNDNQLIIHNTSFWLVT